MLYSQKHLTAGYCQGLVLFIALTASGLAFRAVAQSGPGYYGPGVQFDVLNNAQVAEADVDYRFRAAQSSPAISFIWFNANKRSGRDSMACDGYGCGSGGSVDICIYRDDDTSSHLWTGAPLACVTDSNLRNGDRLRKETFPAPPMLTLGILYHLHWHNTDPAPAKNFVSVNDICVWHPTKPRQPTVSDTDLAVLSGSREIDTDSPIFQINYADGATQGQGYKESWNYLAEDISGGAKVREWFRVSGPDRVVQSVSIRVNRVNGSGPLRVTLATDSGAILEQGEIPASRFSAGARLTSNSYASQNVKPGWGSYVFKSPRKLTVGHAYLLIVSAPRGTVYQVYAIQRASGYGFSRQTFFGDGHGEFSHDNGSTWSGFRQTEESINHTDADIQFYFTLRSKQGVGGTSLGSG
jgi:hypothetical protein